MRHIFNPTFVHGYYCSIRGHRDQGLSGKIQFQPRPPTQGYDRLQVQVRHFATNSHELVQAEVRAVLRNILQWL